MSLRTQDRASDVYTVEQIGRTQEKTPEGYLLCRDVPIARIGEMLYAPGELQDDDGNEIEPGRDGIIHVQREAAEVFRPETIASAVAKPITMDHPAEDVTPLTWNDLAVGLVLNPHQGSQPGEEGLLLADFMFTNQEAIDFVRARTREVSCGYDASYEQTEPGKARQSNIIFNHVALVEHGRCGPRCAIGDNDMLKLRRRPSFKDRMMAFVRAKDEEGAAKALEGIEEPTEDEITSGLGGENDTHIHLHMGGEGGKSSEDESAEGEGEKEPPWFTKHVESSDKRFSDLEGGLAGVLAKLNPTKSETEGEEGKTEDRVTDEELHAEPDGTKVMDAEEDDPDGEKNPLESKDKKTRDAAMNSEYRDIASKAEIIIPGVKLATLDSLSADPAKGLCLLRRRILYRATRDSARAPLVQAILGKNPDLAGMTCAGAKIAFNSIAEVARQANNTSIRAATSDAIGFRPRMIDGGETKPMTVKEINAKNRDFWKDRVS